MFIHNKPEVIAWVRSVYTPERIPDWVGVIEGDVDYREFQRSKGVELPAMVDDRSSVDEDSNDSVEDEEVAQGTIPAQPSTRVANKFDQQTPTDTNGNLRTPTNGNIRQPPMEATANEPRTPTEPKLRTPIEVKEQTVPKKDIPLPLVTVKPKALPVTIQPEV